jgi:hypothetical protein
LRAEDESEQECGSTRQQFHRGRAEVAQVVIVGQPLERVPQVHERERHQNATDAQIALLVGITRRHRHILHDGANGVQAKEQIRLEKISPV